MSKTEFSQSMHRYVGQNKFTLLKLVALVAFLLLLQFNQLVFLADWFKMSSLYLHNQSYLSSVQAVANTDILNFTELLAVTEIASSSTVGVSFFASFNVDIGNVLQSFASLLEQGIGVQLASLAALEILALLNDLSYWVSPLLFKLVLLTSILYYVAKLLLRSQSISSTLYHVGKVAVAMFLLAHIALPYSIHLSSLISQELTQEKRQNLSNLLQNTHNELVSHKQHKSFTAHAEDSLHYLKSMTRKHITHKVSTVSKHVFTSIALNVFDLLIMPILLLVLLYKGCMRIIPVNEIYRDAKSAL
ncbi:hypothetical protein [Marinomonas mediterranea]|uniref:hypothetical protein n=1 Tax=Marinomonas mediterranea TaxID=119864 RepID=UPI002349DD1C|nr:hypothetical protein [Marinomonas mediterranea]WCN08901.1 hypothetical protein GV055_08195 [Marinomonas mediterranea]